jgi:hypothetical protein
MSIADIYAGGSGGGNYGPDAAGGAPGKIVGKVRFEGKDAWATKKLDLTTVDGFCVNGHKPDGLLSEWFTVAPDGALKDVVVYIKEGASGGGDAPKEAVVLDQVKCQYIPHVAVVQLGQPLLIKSSDSILHNVHMIGPAVPGGEKNLSMSRPGELDPITLKKPEVSLRVWCEVHNWMEAWIAIVPHPFHDVTAADGTFTIENVPPGKYKLAAWQEKLKDKTFTIDVTVTAGGTATADFTLTR